MAGTYEARFSRLGQRLVAGVDAKTKAAATGALRSLTLSTPADTGRAIANWRVALGVSGSMGLVLPPYVVGSKGSSRAANASAAYQAGLDVLRSRRPSQSISLYNPVPYIGYLNAGWSKQAPSGFIEMAIQAATVAMQGVKVF